MMGDPRDEPLVSVLIYVDCHFCQGTGADEIGNCCPFCDGYGEVQCSDDDWWSENDDDDPEPTWN